MANLEKKLLHVSKEIESQIDQAIEKINNLDTGDLEQLRKARLIELKKLEDKKREWLLNGHGKYEEMLEEKRFFDVIKKSENVVLHFYRTNSPRCEIVDKHLRILAGKHVETLFTKLNAEKAPFLADNLNIVIIPTIVLIKGSTIVDRIVGFTQLGNRDDFTTEMMEWRIAQGEVISYEGDKAVPPQHQQGTKENYGFKKIRDSYYNRDDDDVDLEDATFSSQDHQPKIKSEHLSPELTPEEAAELGLHE
ncbi:uncharacterized protein LOC109600133 [Aethina tumida]|uniref:uncharacterized protein LOC109600133 n=1 Tax=Aethina tumida TaxID=116153 RepID=UPI0021490A38|nr:uncharacterized protein LOC109600133 [Aethina tumida]